MDSRRGRLPQTEDAGTAPPTPSTAPWARGSAPNAAPEIEQPIVRDVRLSANTGPLSPHSSLSTADFRALYAASPTAVALFEFSPPLAPQRPTDALIADIFSGASRCLEANAAFQLAFGGAVIGRRLAEILPLSAESTALFRQWIDNGFRLACAPASPTLLDRGAVTYELSIYPVVSGDTIPRIWILFRDVSELHTALTAARRAEAHYRTLVERPGLVLVRSRPDNSYVYLSPHIEDIIGYTPDDFKKNPGLMEKLLHPEDIAKHAAVYAARTARSREPVEVEFRVRRKDGAYQWFLERQTPLFGADGAVEFYDSVAIDISERKHLEAQLLHSQRLDTMGRISSGIAHDFSNHLTGIIGQLRLALAALEPTHPARAEIAAAENGALGCIEMTRQILAFGRKVDAPSARVNAAETVESTLQLLRHFLPPSITLEPAIDRDAGDIVATATQIQQVVMNLGINARDAMAAGGSLAVNVSAVTLPRTAGSQYPGLEAGEYAEISVRDTGCGMPPAIARQIFEPFFTTKPSGAGTGLGLSMVKSIVEAHGGGIQVETSPGQGTTVSFVIPRAAPREDEVPAVGAGAARQPGFILIAEDDEAVLHVTSTALDLHGYTVLRAEDGESAIRLFETHADSITLALIDHTMPRRSGAEVIEMIRRSRPRLPVIFTSGHGSTGSFAGISDDRTTVFMGKPYTLTDLLAMVQSLLAPAAV